MTWKFIDTGARDGRFNMNFDLKLAEQSQSEVCILRLYQWKPFAISLGANQNPESVDKLKASAENIDVVKRPTGGRAILHSEELTYSVVYPLSFNSSAKTIYHEINLALLEGLKNYSPELSECELEFSQPNFPDFYKKDIGNICFAVSAKSELKFKGRKLIGSAQRKMADKILQHGSILCGNYHKRISEFLIMDSLSVEEIKNEIDKTTIDLFEILNKPIDYEKLKSSIKKGFEFQFNTAFGELKTNFNLVEQNLN
jgi:lipoate-protein ligase A